MQDAIKSIVSKINDFKVFFIVNIIIIIVITLCDHIYHTGLLRKWLLVVS